MRLRDYVLSLLHSIYSHVPDDFLLQVMLGMGFKYLWHWGHFLNNGGWMLYTRFL
jgi:hypothetical protein